MANTLTTLRLLLLFPFAFLMARGDAFSAALAGITIIAAIATDLLDGAIARQRGTESAAGRVSDHTTDFLFVTSGLVAGATRGVFPWILPLLIASPPPEPPMDSWYVPSTCAAASEMPAAFQSSDQPSTKSCTGLKLRKMSC